MQTQAKFTMVKYYDCSVDGLAKAYFGPNLCPFLQQINGKICLNIEAFQAELNLPESITKKNLDETLAIIE